MATASASPVSPRLAVVAALTPEQGILMTHLVVWLLVLVSGLFLALRFFAIWHRKLVLVVDDGLLAAAWVSRSCYVPPGFPMMPSTKMPRE